MTIMPNSSGNLCQLCPTFFCKIRKNDWNLEKNKIKEKKNLNQIAFFSAAVHATNFKLWHNWHNSKYTWHKFTAGFWQNSPTGVSHLNLGTCHPYLSQIARSPKPKEYVNLFSSIICVLHEESFLVIQSVCENRDYILLWK